MLVVAAIAGFVYSRISRDWSFATFLAGEAAVVVVIGCLGLPWMEFAPDGAFRKQARS
jgi:hypothetical protein